MDTPSHNVLFCFYFREIKGLDFCFFSTYAGSSPQTGPEDLRFSFGYLEYHSDGRHWKLEEWMTISMTFCAKLNRHLDLQAGTLLFYHA